jgi:hypothetical protein
MTTRTTRTTRTNVQPVRPVWVPLYPGQPGPDRQMPRRGMSVRVCLVGWDMSGVSRTSGNMARAGTILQCFFALARVASRIRPMSALNPGYGWGNKPTKLTLFE